MTVCSLESYQFRLPSAEFSRRVISGIVHMLRSGAMGGLPGHLWPLHDDQSVQPLEQAGHLVRDFRLTGVTVSCVGTAAVDSTHIKGAPFDGGGKGGAFAHAQRSK